jgi:general secretion pathway protein D
MNQPWNFHWRRGVSLLLLLLLVTMVAPRHASADAGKKFFKQGTDAEAREDYTAAFDYYHQAWLKVPKNERYRTSYERLRPEAAFVYLKRGRKLRDDGDFTGAITEFLKVIEIDPSLEITKQEIDITRRKMAEAKAKENGTAVPEPEQINEVEAPVELKPLSNEPLTLHLNEDSKVVYQTIGKQAGLNVLFDSDYTGKRIPVDLTNTTLYDALRIVGAISGTFWRPITPNTIFVAQDQRSKHSAYDQMAVRTFYLTNPSQQQDLNDIQTALRSLMGEGPKFYSVPSQNAIVARGTPDQLTLAEKIIDDLDKARAEVLIDVTVLEVDKDLLRNIGIQLPGSFGLTLQAPCSSSTSTTGCTGSSSSSSSSSSTSTSSSSTSPTLNQLASLNATDFAVTLGQATANLLLSDSDTKILQDPRIRATDGQKATLKIGSRIPVATGSYSSGASVAATISPLVQTQFQYLDIGTNVEVTPTIHFDRDVTLKIKIEVLSENGSTTISGVTEPIIGQRSIEHTIRLKEGETNILGGILERTDSKTVSGTPGVGEIPILKYLFSSQQTETQTYEIVFLLTPHVVRAHDVTPQNMQTIDTGTSNSVELRRTSADGVAPAATPATMPARPVPLQPAPPAASNSPVPLIPAGANPNAPGQIVMQMTSPAAPEKVGSTFTVAVQMTGGKDIFSVPMELQYDTSKLMLVNVDNGDLLTSDGQIASLVHRDDNGTVKINTSRPQGSTGVTRDGTVVVASFVAKAPGDANITMTQAMPRNSQQQPMNATGSQVVVHVQP